MALEMERLEASGVRPQEVGTGQFLEELESRRCTGILD